MKKLFITTFVLLTALMAQAQTKISPKLENGFKAVYSTVNTLNMMDMSALTVTSEDEYAVSNVTPEGAVITITNLSMSPIQTEGIDPVTFILLTTAHVLENTTVKLQVNADGVPQKILNLEEVKGKVDEVMNAAITKFFETNAELAQVMPKDKFLEQVSGRIDEEMLLSSFDVLELNGKTVANGYQDTYTNDEGLKMKRMYFVSGNKVISNANLDMSKDEMKAFIISQIEKEAPEQAEAIKQNIDLVMSQLKVEMTEKYTFDLQDNKWPASITSEQSQDSMGQSMKATSVITLKQ